MIDQEILLKKKKKCFKILKNLYLKRKNKKQVISIHIPDN